VNVRLVDEPIRILSQKNKKITHLKPVVLYPLVFLPSIRSSKVIDSVNYD